jgi:hypothetical protein
MGGSKTKRDDGVARKITHPVRFAADEYEQLKQKAYRARISISEFIRRAALRRKVVEAPPPLQLNWMLYKEAHAIGANLNQLVKAVNRAVKAGQHVNVNLEELKELVEPAVKVFRETQMMLLETGASDDGEDE